MTAVNWERLHGETVEELVAGLIAVERPTANHITPSRGDRGMDVRVPNDDGASIDVYQVKRYTRPLTQRQKVDIEHSWMTFLEQTAAHHTVQRWYLAMPLNPTPEALDWFHGLTAHPTVVPQWLDRTQLDAMAAGHLDVVGYYQGDGRRELHDLMALALSAGQPLTGEGTDLLASVQDRHLGLQMALDELDPFWRYEIQTRRGRISDPNEPFAPDTSGAAVVCVADNGDGVVQIVRIFPKTALSATLRPITGALAFELEAGTAANEAVERFRKYGTPITGVPAEVTALTGPPGSGHSGTAFVTIGRPVPPAGRSAVDHDLVVRTLQGAEVARLELADVVFAAGVGGGMSISARDLAGALSMLITVDPIVEGAPTRLRMEIQPRGLASKPVARVLPTFRLLAAYGAGTTITLAIRGGPDTTGGFPLDAGLNNREAVAMLPYYEALGVIQRHTHQPILTPGPETLDAEAVDAALTAARLLDGETLVQPWTALPVEISKPGLEPDRLRTPFAIVIDEPLEVTVGDQVVRPGRTVRTEVTGARLPEGLEPTSLELGQELELRAVEGATLSKALLPLTPEPAGEPPAT